MSFMGFYLLSAVLMFVSGLLVIKLVDQLDVLVEHVFMMLLLALIPFGNALIFVGLLFYVISAKNLLKKKVF